MPSHPPVRPRYSSGFKQAGQSNGFDFSRYRLFGIRVGVALALIYLAIKFVPYLTFFFPQDKLAVSMRYNAEAAINLDNSIVFTEELKEVQNLKPESEGFILRGFYNQFPKDVNDEPVPIGKVTITDVSVRTRQQRELNPEVIEFPNLFGVALSGGDLPREGSRRDFLLQYTLSGLMHRNEKTNEREFQIPLFSLPIVSLSGGAIIFTLPEYVHPDAVEAKILRKIGSTYSVAPIQRVYVEEFEQGKRMAQQRTVATQGETRVTSIPAPNGSSVIRIAGLSVDLGEELYLHLTLPPS